MITTETALLVGHYFSFPQEIYFGSGRQKVSRYFCCYCKYVNLSEQLFSSRLNLRNSHGLWRNCSSFFFKVKQEAFVDPGDNFFLSMWNRNHSFFWSLFKLSSCCQSWREFFFSRIIFFSGVKFVYFYHVWNLFMCQRENLSFLKYVKLSELEFLITVVTKSFFFFRRIFSFPDFFFPLKNFIFRRFFFHNWKHQKWYEYIVFIRWGESLCFTGK